MQLRVRGHLSLLFLLFATACTDSPTSLDVQAGPVGDRRAASQQGEGQGLTAFPCTFLIKSGSGGFRSREAQVRFPASELHPLGTRRMYLYRGYSGNKPVLVAQCSLPATEAAVRRVNRVFNVDGEAQDPSGITTMGCVTTEEGCTLDPVVVDACAGGGTYPNCDTGNDEDYDACYDFGICGGGGDWYWSDPGGGAGDGGGTSSQPGDPCQTGDPVVDDPDVFGGFDDLWKQSIDNGVEKGGWVVRESDGGHRLIPFQNATFFACGMDVYESPPPGAVAMVHTHPWPLFAENPCGYINTGTPSAEDVAALQQTGLATGYFLDAGGIGKFTATAGETSLRTARCGY